MFAVTSTPIPITNIETKTIFKNNPSINIINSFYNYHKNILKILP